ncbi:MAG: glycosyltransferase [Clostridiaceae bacterium]|nr:glycosyltransferase [Clostridiaceae bacterium]
MTVVQLNTVYGKGSTGKIVMGIHRRLMRSGHTSYVLCGYRNKDLHDPNVYAISCKLLRGISQIWIKCSGLKNGGAYLQTLAALLFIRYAAPDIVHIHVINTPDFNTYWILRYLARHQIKTVLSLHGEYFYTAGCEHAYDCDKWIDSECVNCCRAKDVCRCWTRNDPHRLWKRIHESIRRFDAKKLRVICVSDWMAERARKSKMLKNYRVYTIPNGVDTSIFHPTDDAENNIPIGWPMGNCPIILYVTAYFDSSPNSNKGGQFIEEIAKRVSPFEANIVVAAMYGTYVPKNNNVHFLGSVLNQNALASMYNTSDITLVLSKRETFCMPVAESLCCGTPVVGFRSGGPESITPENCGEYVPYGDVNALVDSIAAWLKKKKSSPILRSSIAAVAHELFDENIMAENYLNEYSKS